MQFLNRAQILLCHHDCQRSKACVLVVQLYSTESWNCTDLAGVSDENHIWAIRLRHRSTDFVTCTSSPEQVSTASQLQVMFNAGRCEVKLGALPYLCFRLECLTFLRWKVRRHHLTWSIIRSESHVFCCNLQFPIELHLRPALSWKTHLCRKRRKDGEYLSRSA